MSNTYLLPPRLADSTGATRRAGFEFEFGNLPVVETARALCDALDGQLEIKSPFEAQVLHSRVGRLKVERDANLLKSVKYRKWLQKLGVEFSPGDIGHELETNLDHASRLLVPCEVITDPIPLDKLSALDTLVSTLSGIGAEGTQGSFIYAFGLHINPSIPAADSATLLRYLQAFLLLHAWIIESSAIDITRRFFTKYIDPFPPHYLELVLSVDYQPDQEQLIADYLQYNPTRNRALDMLPIMAHLDAERVMAGVVEEERKLVTGRPAFHYRLPDCRINVPGWSVARPWNQWVHIETLAAQQDLLDQLILAWRDHATHFSLTPNASWVQLLTSLLSQRLLTPPQP